MSGNTLKKYIRGYGLKSSKGVFASMMNFIVPLITGYNHNKYWKYRDYVIDSSKNNTLFKIIKYIYIKRVDSRRLSSFGTMINSGATFATPPILPHGPNGIIIAHDAVIGSNVTIFQQVTIAEGGAVIGDNVILGSGCKVLSGVKIGNNAKIGANSVVVEDIPDGATCVLTKPRIILKGNNSISSIHNE